METGGKKVKMQGKLLIYRWGSLAESALVRAVKENGWEYRVFAKEIKDYHADAEFARELIEVIHDDRISVVFSYDYFPLISMICDINKMPYISWVYDCPQYTLQSETLKNKFNYIFCFDKSYVERLNYMGAVNCFHFPLAGVSNQLTWIKQQEQKQPSLCEKYQCDVSFVGNLYNEKKNRLRQAELSDYTTGYVNGLIESQLLIYGYNLLKDSMNEKVAEEIAEKCQLTLGDGYRQDFLQMAVDAVGMEVTGRDRERVLQKISEKYPVCLYTSSVLPSTLQKENVKNMGYADYQKEMPFVFHNSKINLNITSRTIETGIPQRVFDILSCGGFCLTNYQAEIAEYFTDGEELVMYTGMEDLVYKVNYYLEHEEKRRQIAENGYQKINREFELKDCLQEVIRLVMSE